MRLKLLLGSILILSLGGVIAFFGCYSVGDIGETPYRCYADHPECPDGYECQLTSSPNPKNMNKCVRIGGGMTVDLMLPTQPGIYSGMHQDPGLNSTNCPDADIEAGSGNNNIGTATQGFDDTITHDKLAICPEKDLDVYSINLNAGEFMRVTIKYMIRYGDLDLAIYDSNGMLVTGLFDADFMKDDACVVTTAAGMTAQNYYAVVYGAKNASNVGDLNRYTFRVEKNNIKFSCANMSMPDMAMSDAKTPDLSM